MEAGGLKGSSWTPVCQFADAVVTPSEGRAKGLDLESLLGTLHADPFSSRKQLPRTPESLSGSGGAMSLFPVCCCLTNEVFPVLDVKSSWRKAVEEDRAEKLGRAVAEAVSDASSDGRSNRGVSGGQQGAHSGTPPPLWDTLAADSPSGAVQFSLAQETLPELPSCDSLLSLDEDDRRATPDQQGSASDQDWTRDSAVTTEKVFSLDLDNLEVPSTPKMQEYVLPSLITFSPIDDMKC